jgi:hypothetical protein
MSGASAVFCLATCTLWTGVGLDDAWTEADTLDGSSSRPRRPATDRVGTIVTATQCGCVVLVQVWSGKPPKKKRKEKKDSGVSSSRSETKDRKPASREIDRIRMTKHQGLALFGMGGGPADRKNGCAFTAK